VNPDLLADRLRDIRGLDTISWWPPGPGWWLVVLLIPLLLWVVSRWSPPALARLKPRRRPVWQRAAARELRELRRRIGKDDLKTLSGELSELLRRVAMARCGRESCAGLSGQDWLAWLKRHDPLGFDWEKHGLVLTRVAYAPPGKYGSATVLQTLIDAALAWTRPGEAAACAARDLDYGV
jgi:hypothetical protein